MGFVKNIKDKLSEHFVTNDYDEYESAVSDDDYEDDTLKSSIYDSEKEEPAAEKYSYSPQGTINVPEYNFGGSNTAAPKQETARRQEAPKSGANIFNMNTAKPAHKFKLNSIMLRDIYDAKNVAALMMEKDTIVVVNLSLLSDEQKVRAMDFLDGAKFVTKSVFARFAENICAFVPETVELFGDFFSQIDLDSIK